MTGAATLLYVKGESIGYARMGSQIADRLVARGYDIYDSDGHSDQTERHGPTRLLTEGRRVAVPPTNLACWMSVPSHMDGYWDGQHRAILTMWEARKLPAAFRENLHEFQTVLVPSLQNVELFSKYHDNVHYIPLGVDTDQWYYREPTLDAPEFRFLISGRGERKGVDIAFEAFQRVFGKWWDWSGDTPVYTGPKDMPVPTLLMKSIKGIGEYYTPGVRHISGRLTAEEELELYESAHCYIQPSRGEGFGLQPLQAIAMGRPTILTNAHGHASYADLGIPISATESKAEYFIYGDAGDWWEPDLEEICEAMWDVYQNYAVHAQRAKVSAAVVADQWTWDKTTDRFIEILGDEMGKSYVGDGKTWHSSERLLYRVRVLRDWNGDIAGKSLAFTAGLDYWQPADVKRILFDGGVLDPDCTSDDDHGLAEVQIPQIAQYNADHMACLHCGQLLGSGRMLSDDIFDRLQAEAVAEGRG